MFLMYLWAVQKVFTNVNIMNPTKYCTPTIHKSYFVPVPWIYRRTEVKPTCIFFFTHFHNSHKRWLPDGMSVQFHPLKSRGPLLTPVPWTLGGERERIKGGREECTLRRGISLYPCSLVREANTSWHPWSPFLIRRLKVMGRGERKRGKEGIDEGVPENSMYKISPSLGIIRTLLFLFSFFFFSLPG